MRISLWAIASVLRAREACLVLLLFCGCQPRLSSDLGLPASQRITVMSYNVLGGRNTDGARDLDRIAAVILEVDPDLVALQEVDRHTNRLGGLDLADELASRTGMQHVFGPAMPFDGGEYGVAILSRYPIERFENFALPNREGSEPRTALVAFIEPPGWSEPFLFVSTHLDHQTDSTDRIDQAERLVSVLGAYVEIPGILAGDLNAQMGSVPLSIIQATWNDSWRAGSGGETFPSNIPEKRIDYVMVRPAGRWSVLKTLAGSVLKPDDQEWHELLRLASDHLPVVTILELVGGTK
ncbi:MAG: hypothetical protein HKN37_03690 [Rhodothermales bacterium]|nr:hypothetical protein [Rhodothermales bacterium]